MTLTRIAEIIHEWMGWCPDRCTIPVRKEIPWREVNSNTLTTECGYVNDELIVDYGATGISLPFFIGAVFAGVIGIVAVLTIILVVSPFRVAGILWCGLILSVAIVIFYRDMKKATLEITRDALIIRRSLHRPVVIQKDTIASVEVRHNVPTVPLWLQKVLVLLVIPASSVAIIYGEYLEMLSGEIESSSFFLRLGFHTSIVLFFLAIYYHSYIRSYYSTILVITTNTKKLAGIYGKNPEEIAKLLGQPV
jgi:hypothetical protein